MYHHGEIYGYSLYTVSALKVFLGNYTDDPDKKTEAVITERQKISILTLEYDKDHNEVFKIYRGVVKEISTNAVRYDMGKEARMKCMQIKMDCSSEESSDIQYICLANIVEIHDIDYEYKEIDRDVYILEEHPAHWRTPNDKYSDIDLTLSGEGKLKTEDSE